jgi:putative copper export protein
MPVFAPDGGPALVLARGFAVAFLLSVSGTLAFRAIVMPRALERMAADIVAAIEGGLRRWIRVSAAGAVLGLLAWLITVTGGMAAPQTLKEWPGDIWAVLSVTSFGHVLLVQLALLAMAVLVLGRHPDTGRWRIALVPGSMAAMAEVGHGHAYAMASSVLEISELLHLWAAGAWLGGLLPLLLVVLVAPPASAALAARYFTPLGKLCVALLAGTAVAQGVVLVGSVDALLHTAYGWVALLKLCLFGVLVGFALANRYRLAPDLRGPDAWGARRRLLLSLGLQTGFGVTIVFAASLLGQLRPGMDMGMGMQG